MNLALPSISSEPSSSFFSRVAIVTQRPRQHSLNPPGLLSHDFRFLSLLDQSLILFYYFKGFWKVNSISLSLYRA